ncbi:hypothetical protein [Bacillus sp. H2FL2]|uniref:hypothetical protein n=1 Tax=Bacillus sp. H2FL2 TaxID=2994531 RepID=UPI00224ACC63|nr:hypothetical protein [Bacillus sp. H2FL2]MCX2773104.1 hypothetical protein [Bacillus sp. H2FL2]
MFKRRLFETLSWICSGAAYLVFVSLMIWSAEFPVAKAIFTIAAVFGLLLVGLYGIVRFILWLIVEPYRAHKREKARAAE